MNIYFDFYRNRYLCLDKPEIVDKKLVEVILLNREGKLKIKPGYDGVYGEVLLNKENTISRQKSLEEF